MHLKRLISMRTSMFPMLMNDGFADGLNDGFADTMNDGFADGLNDGFSDGLAEGLYQQVLKVCVD